MRSTHPIDDEAAREKNFLIQLGERVLCNGYTGGGIMSDMMLPGLSTNDDGTKFWFDWKAFFTSLFTEEMLAKRMKDGILEWFIPTNGKTTLQTSRATVHEFLTIRYQVQRRWMLMHYRNHFASTSPDTTSAASFVDTFVDPSYSHEPLRGSSPSALFANLNPMREESMVFHVPDWRSLSVREIARLRAVEVRDLQDLFVYDFLIDEKEDLWIRGLEGWEGKRDVDEQVLEEELRLSEAERWKPGDAMNTPIAWGTLNI